MNQLLSAKNFTQVSDGRTSAQYQPKQFETVDNTPNARSYPFLKILRFNLKIFKAIVALKNFASSEAAANALTLENCELS